MGREAEIRAFHRWLDRARHGTRQMIFVTGETGVGKTTTVEAFVKDAARQGNLWIKRGQCIDHYGAGEAYMPVLEALEQLCRAPEGERLVGLLARHAPTWLVQMPWLLSTADLDRLQRVPLGTTQERMLREMARTLEALTLERPLILVLEDLHWSDRATLELLSVLARRQESARLMLIGTYRSAELLPGHPLHDIVRELVVHGLCEELPLPSLTETAVRAYVTARWPRISRPDAFAHLIHRRTEGNPLFIVNMLAYMETQHVLDENVGIDRIPTKLLEAALWIPESLRQLLAQQFERLRPEEQRMLEVASIVGTEFAAATVAWGLETEVEQVEAWCAALARRGHWLLARGQTVWADGTVSERYGFVHALYPEVIYARVTAARRLRLHRRIGERLEVAFGEQAHTIAAELAMHYEHGRHYPRAIQYRRQAADNAIQRCAYQEAIAYLSAGLEILTTRPESAERRHQELAMHLALGAAFIATKGQAAPEVEQTYLRARALCHQVGTPSQLFQAIMGLERFYLVRGAVHKARELGDQSLALAHKLHDPELLLQAHRFLGFILFHLGALVASRTHFEQALALYDRQQHRTHAFLYAIDPEVSSLSRSSMVLWMLGFPGQARQRCYETLVRARDLRHPSSQAFALYFAAWLLQHFRDLQAVRTRADAVIALSTEQGFALWKACGTVLRGWALVMQGQYEAGMADMHQGMAAYQHTGAELELPYFFALLAQGYETQGHIADGLEVLDKAMTTVAKTGERYYEAELHRLRGALLLRPPASDVQQAETCLHRALTVARQQHATALELRAATTLSRLWYHRGKRDAARQLLAAVYSRFPEGLDTADLQEAKTLRDKLARLVK